MFSTDKQGILRMTKPELFSLDRRRFVQVGRAVAASACLPSGLLAAPAYGRVGGQAGNWA